MSIFSWFSRPAWHTRDALKRADAVARGRESALLAELPQIVRNDPDTGVRRAALERIDDLTLVADRMKNDDDSSIRERARTRLVDLLVGKAPLAERRRALGLVEDQFALEQIARRASEVDMRRVALERCKRSGFISERALDDSDGDLRIELLARIDHLPTLERIAQHARTRDKRLYRAIRERLDAGKLAAGEGNALLARAEALCVQIEQQLRSPGAGAATQLATVEAEWTSLRARIDDRLDRRFDGAVQTLHAALGAISRIGEEPAPEPEVLPEVVTEPVELVEEEPAAPLSVEPDPQLIELLAQAQQFDDSATDFLRAELERGWQLAFAQIQPRNAPDRALAGDFQAQIQRLRAAAQARAEERTKLIDAAKGEAELAIAKVEAAIEAGQLSAARAARATARAVVEAAPADLARGLSRKLSSMDSGIEKLAQWQRWSDNKVRARLCEEVEALIGSGMHPDGLANKLVELKAAWKRIDDSEIDPAAPAVESGFTKRFRFLCHKALEPARGYFEKRKEVRGKRGEEIGAFIERARAELETPGAENAAIILLKREAGDRLRRVDELDPRQRGEMVKQLKALIDAGSALIDARFAAVIDEKQKLIAQLRRQLTHAEPAAALDLAKAAQKRWPSLGKGSQKTDQALWVELRSVIDPLFEQRKEAQKAADAERDAGRAAAQSLIDELRGLPSSSLDATHLDAEIERIEAVWRADESRPADFERSLDDAISKARAASADRRRGELDTRGQRVNSLAIELDGLEATLLQGGDINAAIDALSVEVKSFDNEVAAAFAKRIAQLQVHPPGEAAQGDLSQAERLTLEYEFLAGVESPPSEQAARLNMQVEKLAARMSTGQSRTAHEERAALNLRWWAIGPLSVADRERLNERRARALGAKG